MSIFCNNCGRENKDTSKFCSGCGGGFQQASSPSGPLTPGTILENRYKIVILIKAGGMGAVYKAVDTKFDSICAVKELLPPYGSLELQKKATEWFKREAQLLNKLDHSNLPKVTDYFVSNGRYYLVMNYIEGEDLETILKRDGTPGLPEEKVRNWSTQILIVLDYLHNQELPIVYRDLKPGNIMIHKDGRAMLVDFGIARVIQEASQTKKTAIGTAGYAAPEQCRGHIEPRSDIYALGATMHHLLTGILPVSPLMFEPLKKVRPDISLELDAIIVKALEVDLSNRFSSAKEMKKALEHNISNRQIIRKTTTPAVANIPGQDLPISKAPPVKKGKKTDNTLFSVGIAIIFLISLGGILGNNYFNNPDRLKEIADKSYREGDFNTAKIYYQKVLKYKEKDLESLLNLGEIAREIDKEIDEAIEYYNKVLEIDSNNNKAKTNLMILYMKEAEEAESLSTGINYYLKALELAPDNKKINLGLLDLYMRAEDYNEAKKILDNMYSLGEKNEDSCFLLGDNFFLRKDYENSIDCFNKILEVNPNNIQAYRNLSKCYQEQKEYNKVISENKKIIALSSKDIQAHIDIGNAYYNKKDYSSANKWFDKALSLNPDGKQMATITEMSYTCYMNMGKSYFSQEVYKEAYDNFINALDKKPDSKEAKDYIAKIDEAMKPIFEPVQEPYFTYGSPPEPQSPISTTPSDLPPDDDYDII